MSIPLRAGLIFVIAFIVGPFYLAYSQATQPAADAPRLVIERTRHNFGDVFTGEILSIVFRVRNLGTRQLELSEHPILTPRRVSAPASELAPTKAVLISPRRAAPS